MILRLSLVMFVPSRMATSPPLILQEGKAKVEGGRRGTEWERGRKGEREGEGRERWGESVEDTVS